MAALQIQVQGRQVRTPGRPRVLGQAADDFPEPALYPASGPDRGVHCGAVLLEPARATCSKEVACICASSSTFIRSFHVSLHVQIKRQNFQ